MQSNKNLPASKKDDSSILDTIGTYLPYWPLFLVCLIITMVGAVLYMHFTTPKYEATATIIIKDEKKGDEDSKMMESLALINTKKIVENEIEVFQSRPILDAVVKKLYLYAPISQKDNLLTKSAYVTSPVSIEAQNPDSLSESEEIEFTYNPSTNKGLINNTYTVKLNQWFNTPYGFLRMIPNPNYKPSASSKQPFYFTVSEVKDVSAGMGKGLKVAPSSKLSSVIGLSYRDEVPKKTEDILNNLIAGYSEAALADKNSLANSTVAFVETRLKLVKRDLDSIENKLQKYKTGKGVVDISAQGQLYLQNVSSNDERLGNISTQVDIMNQLEKSASTSDNVGMIPSTLGITDPTLIQQMTNLSSLQNQYDKLKSTVAENNPLLVSIKDQIAQLRPTIVGNIRNLRQSLEKSKANLYASAGAYNSELSYIPQKERELVQITRDQTMKNTIYNFLLQKREESELSYASTISDSRIVNYAQSSKYPVSPNLIFVILVAIILAFGIPIAYISAKENLNPKILYRSEIESLSQTPVIGEVSFAKSKDMLVIGRGKRTVIAEEFRKLRVSLLSLGFDQLHKKILVTSNLSGEGKSFIASNLAISISLTGKKVVLVDLDLHNPGLGKFFNIKEQPGVGEFLIGNKTLDQIIYNIPGNENLFYISSGTLQQDASELLENGKVQQLINQLNLDYDAVIIDAAPIVLITDAYLLSSLCDATLFVVRHKFTPKVLIKRFDEGLAINPIKNPAFVFNSVKTRGYFKNNYGYGYNYVYSYDNKKTQKEKKVALKKSKETA